ncbi:MAG: fumarate/nitrate reduction transcriptional regulator Fnr [Gammaproteobacteria bacterium]
MAQRNADKIVNLSQIKVACKQCMLHQLCLPIGIDGGDLDRLEQIIHRSRPLKRGEHLFNQGEGFRSIYAVRSGSLKTYTISDTGQEQITGFHLPGELVGLDAIVSEHHPCAARALETTSYCEIPFDRLEELSGHLPSLRHQLLRLMSKEILRDQELLMLLGKRTAEERLATLLVSLSARFKERGFSAQEFHLSMSRNDIGNYLGLAVETVSRLFTRFQDQELMEVNGKHVRLLDAGALSRLTGNGNPARARNPGSA